MDFRLKRLVVFAIVILVLMSLSAILVKIYPDLLWFSMVSYLGVYKKILITKIFLGFVVSLVFLTITLGNLYFLHRFSPARFSPKIIDAIPIGGELDFDLRKIVYSVLTLLSIGYSILMGYSSSSKWEIVLRYLGAENISIGNADPIFDKDISYYIFRMPLEQFICSSLFGVLVLLTIFTSVIYFFHGAIFSDRNRLEPPQKVKAHLFALIALTLIFFAWNCRFMMFELLNKPSSDVVRVGGGYAAIHARLPLLWVTLVSATVSGIVFFISMFFRRVRYALGMLILFFTIFFVGQFYPTFVQRFRVEPNKQELEAKYIKHNIEATLHAYGLTDKRVTEEEYPLTGELTYEDVMSQENAAVINSSRLWDWRPLRRTFRQLQELRSQYDFVDVDVDRYQIDGNIRQVMLSGRELNINDLPSARKDWYKKTYVYTHGYGAVMSPVSEIEDGKPKMYIRDIDPITYAPEWNLKFADNPGPRIYYGERTTHYIITHPGQEELLEFDYPLSVGQEYKTYAYQGQGGIELSSPWRRLVYMLKFNNEIKFVLPGPIKRTSRVMYHRHIKERTQKIAPFLHYDKDPYLVIHEGRLIWMLDAYTTTNRYPYSSPMQDVLRSTIAERQGIRTSRRIQGGERPWGNYIRNSVKVTIDAYDGTVNFYRMDREDDSIVQCYDQIFPNLFKPFSEMPDNLKTHIRYPMTMFLIQARMYQDYHMKDPITFYAGEDPWQIGQEIYDNTEQPRQPTQPVQSNPFAPAPERIAPTVSNVQDVAPYYVIVKIPGQERAEFVLMLPFTPKNKRNLTAWMAARCDLPQYGQLIVYRFSKGKLASGPMQVENYISQEPDISQQISLWNTQGSRVLRGNLLIIPMSESLLYVEPIYIQSEGDSAIPELRRVVVGYREKVAWGASLDQALIKLFNVSPMDSMSRSSEKRRAEATNLPADDISLDGSLIELAKRANQYLNQAQKAQRSGDWASYGTHLNLLEKVLKQMENQNALPSETDDIGSFDF
ncbi:TPA: UPF0182 family protein [Candidatus Poribacteria bacterium]|nr:UPF0182 family protein [Candidatus Poribacteria bacterium]